MKPKIYAWWLKPGFTMPQALKAFAHHGAEQAIACHDEISTRPRKGWRKIYIRIEAQRATAP